MRLKILIPKGRIYENIEKLFADAGITIKLGERAYRPAISADWLDVKVMKPQNVGELLELGSHDAGFTGIDWIREKSSDVVELLDLGFDKVRIVAAIPENYDERALKTKRIVAATEYVNLAERYLRENNYNYRIVRTYGATEVFPPDDADMIIDNTATGQTLLENNLKIISVVLESSTRFFASRGALDAPEKREKIEELVMLFRAVLEAREKVMLEMNVGAENYKSLIGELPAMRSPTVAPLYNSSGAAAGYAVKIAVPKNEVACLIPRLKKLGASDIVEYALRKVVP